MVVASLPVRMTTFRIEATTMRLSVKGYRRDRECHYWPKNELHLFALQYVLVESLNKLSRRDAIQRTSVGDATFCPNGVE